MWLSYLEVSKKSRGNCSPKLPSLTKFSVQELSSLCTTSYPSWMSTMPCSRIAPSFSMTTLPGTKSSMLWHSCSKNTRKKPRRWPLTRLLTSLRSLHPSSIQSTASKTTSSSAWLRSYQSMFTTATSCTDSSLSMESYQWITRLWSMRCSKSAMKSLSWLWRLESSSETQTIDK